MRSLRLAFVGSCLPPAPATPRWTSASTAPPWPRRGSVSEEGSPVHHAKKISTPGAALSATLSSCVAADVVKARSFRPSPELGLLSLFFVLSMAVGSMLCLAIVSLPTMSALRRLVASMRDLSRVVSEEVPGTLSSLRLSVLEINELTRQLRNVRQMMPGSRGRRARNIKND